MPTIRHRVGIDAPQAAVYDAVATTDGLRNWWVREVVGDSEVGNRLEFYMGRPTPGVVMEVVELEPSSLVHWRSVDGPAEWIGTELTFELASSAEESVLSFTHSGWRDPSPFMHHCSTKWAYFLIGLKTSLEGAPPTPYPDDLKISSWG